MAIEITEKLDYQDFMEANFPHVLAPFYTKRLFIINIAFAVLFSGASIYIFTQSIKNGVKLSAYHYGYAFFALLFIFLSFYLIKKEKTVYQNLVNDINALETKYLFNDEGIQVSNEKTTLKYHRNEIKSIDELDKWYVFNFKNQEKLTVYKPNLGENEVVFKQLFGGFL